MPIRVTCTKCHTRFNVSDKFAGKEGPCPKCKTTIRVPDKSEEVVISSPKPKGPMDSKGRPILKPIRRKETILSGVQITLIVASIIGFLAAAFVLRVMITDKSGFTYVLQGLAAFAIAPALVFVAYAFLRDQELEPFRGKELWVRVAICSAVYSLTWLALPLASFAFNDSYEIGSYVAAAVVMFAVGGVASMSSLELDYLMGTVHYGLYLGICLIGRWIAIGEVLPTNPPEQSIPAAGTVAMDVEPMLQLLATCLPCFG